MSFGRDQCREPEYVVSNGSGTCVPTVHWGARNASAFVGAIRASAPKRSCTNRRERSRFATCMSPLIPSSAYLAYLTEASIADVLVSQCARLQTTRALSPHAPSDSP